MCFPHKPNQPTSPRQKCSFSCDFLVRTFYTFIYVVHTLVWHEDVKSGFYPSMLWVPGTKLRSSARWQDLSLAEPSRGSPDLSREAQVTRRTPAGVTTTKDTPTGLHRLCHLQVLPWAPWSYRRKMPVAHSLKKQQ